MSEIQQAVLECPCGKQTRVFLTQAGISFQCSCGRESSVPPLSELKACLKQGRVAKLQPDSPPPVDDERSCVILMTASPNLRERISSTALTNYVAAVDREIDQFSREHEEKRVHLQVAVALLPDHKCLLELQVWPKETPDCDFQILEARLKNLTLPRVTGPVAFAMRHILWNGASTPPKFDLPFAEHFQGRSGPLDDLLWQLAGRPIIIEREILEGLPWWTRLWRAVTGRSSKADGSSPDVVKHNVTSDEDHGQPMLSRGFLPELLQGHSKRNAGLLEQALECYDRAIEFCDDNADAYVVRGDTHCRLGSSEKGLADFSQAIRLDPQHADALAARGTVYLQLEAWDQAISDFRSADRLVSGREPGIHLNLARALVGKQDLLAALEECSRAFEQDPHNADAHSLRAAIQHSLIEQSLLGDDKLNQVLDDWTAAIRIDPEDISSFVCRANLRLQLQDFQNAVQDCDAALKLDPDYGPAYATRGMARLHLGDGDGACEDCTKAIDLQAATAGVYWTRAAIYEAEEQFESALRDCNLAQELKPDAPWIYNSRGSVRLALEELDAALDDFSRAISLAPTWGALYGNRANVYRCREDYQRAIADYSKAIELDPDLAMAYFNRALCWFDLEKHEQTLSDLDHVAALLPDFAATHFYRGLVHTKRGQYQRAIAAYDRLLELDPDCANAVYNRAQLHACLENEEAALEDFSKLIEEYPSVPTAYCARGNVWIQRGDFERGRKDFENAISCDPGAAEELSIYRLLMEAQYFFEHQQFDRCVEHANEALAMDATCSSALRMRAAAYWYSEQFVEAVDDFTALLAECGESPDLLSGRGQVYAELGEFDFAISDLNKAIELAEEENLEVLLAYARNGRGLANSGLGRHQEAAEDFSKSIQLCPRNAWLYYNQALAYIGAEQRKEATVCFRLSLGVDGVKLTPRKKQRAEAFLQRSARDGLCESDEVIIQPPDS